MSSGRPDLSGVMPVSEVARIIGRTRQRVDQLTRDDPTFPEPIWHWPPRLRLWWRPEVEAWARDHPPR